MTSERTCGPYCCATIFIGTLPGRKPGTLAVFASRARRFCDLALDLGERHATCQPAFELPERFQSRLHTRRFLANVESVVRKGGLEPPRLSPPAPKAGASTNSATFAAAFRETGNYSGFSAPRRQRRRRAAAAAPSPMKSKSFRRTAPAFACPSPITKIFPLHRGSCPAAAAGGGRDLPFARAADDIADEGDRRPRSGWPPSTGFGARSTHRRGRAARRAAVSRSSPRAIARHAPAARAVPRPAVRVPPGRDDHALRRPSPTLLDYCRRSANPDRPAAAASLRRGRRRRTRAQRRHLHGAAARQLLAGHRRRLAEGPRVPPAGRPRALRRRRRRRSRERAATTRWRELLAFETARTRALLESGRPLDARAALAARRWSSPA